MIGVVFAILFIVALLGLCAYGVIFPRYMVKHARQVDVRVISCEYQEKELMNTGEVMRYYEVKVDFYGKHGEQIVKTLKREEPIEVGEVIRSRYDDRSGRLLLNADEEVTNGQGSGVGVVVSVLLFMLVIIILGAFVKDKNGEMPQWVYLFFGYLIALIFVGVGIYGIVAKIAQHQPLSFTPVFGLLGAGLLSVMIWQTVDGIRENTREPETQSNGQIQVFFMHSGEDAEAFSYEITFSEDGAGEMLLFPVTRVSDKTFEQVISFAVSKEDYGRLAALAEKVKAKEIPFDASKGAGEMLISVYWYEGDDRVGTGGCEEKEPIFGEVRALVEEIVPSEVFAELAAREAAYYE